MNEPKLHHYVPRIYLRNFTNADGRLWVYDKQSGASFAVSPDKIAAEHGFNSVPKLFEEAGDPLQVETAFAVMESDAAPVLARILTQVRAGSVQDAIALSAGERFLLSEFISSQYFRTREMRELLAFLFEEAGPDIPLASEEEEKAAAFAFLGTAGVIEAMSESIHDAVWVFAKNTSNMSLVTSDHPVCIKDANSKMWIKGVEPLKDGSYVVYPLAPDVVMYCKEKSRWQVLRRYDCKISPVVLTEEMVEHENAGQAFASTRFIFSNQPSFTELEEFIPSIGTNVHSRERTADTDAALQRTVQYLSRPPRRKR
jgi:hypothetical protein